MENYTLPELIYALAMVLWPICILLIVIILKKDIRKLLLKKYSNKYQQNKETETETSIESELETEEPDVFVDDEINVAVRRHSQTKKYFIVINEYKDKSTMILPTGDTKEIEKKFFCELEEFGLDKLLKQNLITEQQSDSYKKYIDSDAGIFINEPISESINEPTYVKSYRRMLNNPNTMPSKMLKYIKSKRKTTWYDLKKFLTCKYGYRYSGSYSASLRVLYIDNYVKILGHGDNKIIEYIEETTDE